MQFRTVSKEDFYGKLEGMRMLNAKGTILKEINVPFIAHFCHCKHSSCLNIFSTHLVVVHKLYLVYTHVYVYAMHIHMHVSSYTFRLSNGYTRIK